MKYWATISLGYRSYGVPYGYVSFMNNGATVSWAVIVMACPVTTGAS